MSSGGSYELGIVCEARADRDTACGLADRVFQGFAVIARRCFSRK